MECMQEIYESIAMWEGWPVVEGTAIIYGLAILATLFFTRKAAT